MTQNTEKSLSKACGEFIRQKRMALGWSSEDLAERAFGDKRRKSFISAIENDRKSPSLKTVEYILECMGAWVEFKEK